MDGGDNINVAIRVRPLNRREIESDTLIGWEIEQQSIVQLHPSEDRPMGPPYLFDHVFGPDVCTNQVYDDVAHRIVCSAMDGINGTIFAYGQTSSGKTHTMRGNHIEPGLIPMAVRNIFNVIQQTPEREFLLRVSYMEIYNEVITDLLQPNSTNLKIHEDIERGVIVGKLKEEIVISPDQVLELMQQGEAHRHVGRTNMNEFSSRSHTIFRMIIESREVESAESAEKKTQARRASRAGGRIGLEGAVKVSLLNLVDLAGSERAQNTGAEGLRLREGSHINKSLLTLSSVISKLADPSQSRGHIPFRDSKLTRILQPALGGNTKTAIICTVTPAASFSDETHSTLKFASRAKKIQNKPKVNEVMDDHALLRRQMKELEDAKKRMLEDKEAMMHQLEEHEKLKDRHENIIARLTEFLVSAANVKTHESAYKKQAKAARRRHRETWCPGEGKPLPGTASNGNGDGGSREADDDDAENQHGNQDKMLAFGSFSSGDIAAPFHRTSAAPSSSSNRSFGALSSRSSSLAALVDSPERTDATATTAHESFGSTLEIPHSHNTLSTQDSISLLERNSELEAEVASLRAELARAAEVQSELESECSEAQRLVQETQQECEELKHKLDDASVQIEDLRETVGMLEQENESLSLTSQSAIAALEEREEQCIALENSLRALRGGPAPVGVAAKREAKSSSQQQQLVSKQRDAAVRVQQQLQEKIDKLQAKLTAVIKERSQDVQTKATMEREFKTMQRQLEVLEKERSKTAQSVIKLKETLATLSKTQKTLEIAEKRAEGFERRCGELELQCASYQEHIKQFEREYAQLEANYQQALEQCERLEADKAQLGNEVMQRDGQLHSERAEAQKRTQEFEHRLAQVMAAMEAQAADADSVVAQLEAELNATHQELATRTSELEESMTAALELEQQLNNATEDWNVARTEFEQRIEQLQAEQREQQSHAHGVEQTLRGEIEQHVAQIATLNDSCFALEAEKARMLTELTELNFQIEEERAESKSRALEWEAQHAARGEALAHASSTNERLEQQAAQLRDEIAQLQAAALAASNEHARALEAHSNAERVWHSEREQLEALLQRIGNEREQLGDTAASVQVALERTQIALETARAEWEIREAKFRDEERERAAEAAEKEAEQRLREQHLRERIDEVTEELKLREEDLEMKETEWLASEQRYKTQLDDMTALHERLQQEMAERQTKVREGVARIAELELAMATATEEWAAKRRQYLELMKEKKASWQRREEQHLEKHRALAKQVQQLRVEWANRQEEHQRSIDELQASLSEREAQHAAVLKSHTDLKAQVRRWLPALQQCGLLPASAAVAPSAAIETPRLLPTTPSIVLGDCSNQQ